MYDVFFQIGYNVKDMNVFNNNLYYKIVSQDNEIDLGSLDLELDYNTRPYEVGKYLLNNIFDKKIRNIYKLNTASDLRFAKEPRTYMEVNGVLLEHSAGHRIRVTSYNSTHIPDKMIRSGNLNLTVYMKPFKDR